MSNDFVTQSSARRCCRLILNGSGAWRKFCQSEFLGDEQDGELKRAGCALSTLQGEGWDQIQGNTASFAFDHPLLSLQRKLLHWGGYSGCIGLEAEGGPVGSE